MTTTTRFALALVCGMTLLALSIRAQSARTDGPQWAGTDELLRPVNYREWVFLSSGLGMAYNEPAADAKPRPPSFTNIFVNPSAYRAFLQTGTWPDNTIFVLEARSSETTGSINKGGRFQTDLRGIEAEVKDTKRFPPNGWAFFAFGAGERAKERTGPLPKDRDCYSCHAEHGAVDNTFVQFYPTLLEVARQKGTVKSAF